MTPCICDIKPRDLWVIYGAIFLVVGVESLEVYEGDLSYVVRCLRVYSRNGVAVTHHIALTLAGSDKLYANEFVGVEEL
jgi:hypothetical protein